MEFDLENPLTPLEDLFILESDHMPSKNYQLGLKNRAFDASQRQEAISFISNLELCSNSASFESYLAVNYLDRFLSIHGFLKGKQWIMRLLAVSCASLATKMLKAEHSLSVFQWDEDSNFDSQTVLRMEVLILGVLKWRMRSITPFSFVDFFISLYKLHYSPSMITLKARASQYIFKSQLEVDLINFKPSIIAAAAVLSAAHELLLPTELQCLRTAIFNCSFVDKENLLGCCHAMQGILLDVFESPVINAEEASSSGTTAKFDRRNRWRKENSSEGSKGGHLMNTVDTNTIRSSDSSVKKRKAMSNLCGENSYQQKVAQIQQC